LHAQNSPRDKKEVKYDEFIVCKGIQKLSEEGYVNTMPKKACAQVCSHLEL
jgi:hypothetical protein